MKIEKGYTLSQFIDLLNSKKVKDKKSIMYGLDTEFLQLVKYNEFLKQPLTKDMFVNEFSSMKECKLCNGSGEYHYGGSFGGSVQYKKCDCVETRKAFSQEAEKKVIFKDGKIIYNSEYNILIEYSPVIVITYNKIHDSFKLRLHDDYFFPRTISDLFQATNGELELQNVEL